MDLALVPLTGSLIACMALVVIGSAVQVTVGAGLSVVCGPLLILRFGAATGVPILLCLNLLISIVASVCDSRDVRWPDAILAGGLTLAGCVVASMVTGLSDAMLKLITAGTLIVVALPRPPRPEKPPGKLSATIAIALASLVTGALTVWTATPGPITPIAFARAGRSGTDIRQTMQPISVVGYGAALAWMGLPSMRKLDEGLLLPLVAATLVGIGLGYALRPRIDAARVVLLIRVVAGAAAVLLILSVVR